MSINPDFTKVALPDHPSCSYDEWKKNLEEKMGENYDALYDTTLERIPKAPLYTNPSWVSSWQRPEPGGGSSAPG